MSKTVVGHRNAQGKYGPLRHIRVEKMANGFAVHQEHDGLGMGPHGMPIHEPEPPPAVFTQHAKAKKHISDLLAQMHPPNPTDQGDAESSAGAGGEPDGSSAPVAQME